jgi:N-acetylglucosamine-6-phosphate deacetylase
VSDALLVLDAGTVLTPFEKFSPGRIIVRGNRIERAGLRSDVPAPEGAKRIDAPNLTIVPGFIDPHVHGCGGIDVMQATRDSMDAICRMLSRHGTTTFLPTTISAPVEELTSAIARLASHVQSEFSGAQPLGIHLEGPFLNIQKRGTHQPAYMRQPDASLLEKLIDSSQGTIKLITMAPELEGAAALADLARKSALVVGMGHSDASFAESRAAADAGTRYAVHTFNAMRGFSHRDPGIVGAVLSDDRIFAETIADGVHVAPEVIRIFARAKGSDRIILATDATSATGMPDGRYHLGSSHVQVTGGICRDDDGRLAGSTLTQDRALRNLVAWGGIRLDDALRAVTSNPASALSLEGRGRIEPGSVADLTFLDSSVNVVKTYAGGRLVFDSSP